MTFQLQHLTSSPPFNISQTVNQTYLEDASGESSDCPSMKKFQASVRILKKKTLAEYTSYAVFIMHLEFDPNLVFGETHNYRVSSNLFSSLH